MGGGTTQCPLLTTCHPVLTTHYLPLSTYHALPTPHYPPLTTPTAPYSIASPYSLLLEVIARSEGPTISFRVPARATYARVTPQSIEPKTHRSPPPPRTLSTHRLHPRPLHPSSPPILSIRPIYQPSPSTLYTTTSSSHHRVIPSTHPINSSHRRIPSSGQGSPPVRQSAPPLACAVRSCAGHRVAGGRRASLRGRAVGMDTALLGLSWRRTAFGRPAPLAEGYRLAAATSHGSY